MAAIFLVTFLLTGNNYISYIIYANFIKKICVGFDVTSALMVFAIVAMILINMAGLMWAWNISLNAVSLVNLVVVSYNPSRQIGIKMV